MVNNTKAVASGDRADTPNYHAGTDVPCVISSGRASPALVQSVPNPRSGSRSPITLVAVVAYSWYITVQISGLRKPQNDLAGRNRKDSLQLLRIQNDLNSLALAMRDMLDNDEPYPLTALLAQFERIRADLNDALKLEEQVARPSEPPSKDNSWETP